MARSRRKLGEILVRQGVIDENKINKALNVAKGSKKRLGEALIELEFLKPDQVARGVAEQFGMEFIDLDQLGALSADVRALLPEDMIKKYHVIPLGKENGKLKVVLHDPMDLQLMDDLRFRLNADVQALVAPREKIKGFIEEMYSESRDSIDKALKGMSMDMSMDLSMDSSIDVQGMTIDQDADDSEAREQAPIIRLVRKVIAEAVKNRASDIHIEPFVDRVRLRYRIDGRCHEWDRIPKRTQAAITARLKIMSGMKVEEKRIPQDGRIKLKIDGDTIDFRVSACPAYHGESIVMRILRPDAAKIGLINLGLRQDTLDLFNQIIRRPTGIFLVTGPTGSGKTTTLYSALDVLNRPDRKIITAEDPVEYNFKGINQCQVNEHIGLSFARILRAMLRQAPNVILVGEIRDREVGDVAIQAALTGHLVFSTLHTNDAPSAITRLIDMGIKPFLVASSIQSVLAQRLVRMLCPECKQPDTSPNKRMLNLMGFRPQDIEGKTLYKANGCSKCSNTGYRGRKGIYEMMVMNSELRELAFKRAPLSQIRAAALANGMRNLLGDGRLKILDGLTTLEEVARIAQIQGIVEAEETEEVAV